MKGKGIKVEVSSAAAKTESDGINNHIFQNIESYINQSLIQPYALLIRGSWGCGKTHLIKSVISASQRKKDFIYISLFGISSLKELDNKHFQAYLKSLSAGIDKQPTDTCKFKSFFCKLFTKAPTILSNLSLGSTGISIDPQTFGLANLIPKHVDKILVFDDLERVSIPLKDVLGYINKYVEHNKNKAILIADEKRILTSDIIQKEDREHYRLTKEKVIAKFFDVEPDFLSMFHEVLGRKSGGEFGELLHQHQNLVQKIFDTSGCNNLRILGRAIDELEILFLSLDKRVKEKPVLVQELVQLHLILWIEYQINNLEPHDIETLIGGNIITRRMKKKEESDPSHHKFYDLDEKYVTFGDPFYMPIMETENWVDYLRRGIPNRKKINKALLGSEHFFEEIEPPTWRKIMDIWDLDDAQFKVLISDLNTRFSKKEYVVMGEIFHICAFYLWLDSKGLYENKMQHGDVETSIRQYVDDVASLGLLVLEPSERRINFHYQSYAGITFFDHESKKFQAFRSYASDKYKQMLNSALLNQADEILELLQTNPQSLFGLLCDHENSAKYADVPILAKTDPQVFLQHWLSLKPEYQRDVINILKKRYQQKGYVSEIKEELSWLLSLKNNLNAELKGRERLLSGLQLTSIYGSLLAIIENIESTLKEE